MHLFKMFEDRILPAVCASMDEGEFTSSIRTPSTGYRPPNPLCHGNCGTRIKKRLIPDLSVVRSNALSCFVDGGPWKANMHC
jgi:hypothetical protein